ncbi:MAG: cysteine--tRNA ligase, partial [Symploca sp. SIO2B6]|nr:cysteine--tRNA ligase [Symploca sp. SIO2B6]
MTIQIYNTLTRQKNPFEPLEPGTAKIYCCGVTVYDYCHLGHARCYMVWDTVRRYLQWRGYNVQYVQNFTDIDDKILKRAVKEGSSMEAVSERFTQAYLEDMARLNVMEADEYPRATHTIEGIQRLIRELEQKEVAYTAGGDVYYSVNAFPEYGKLSGRKLDDMKAGASGRVDNSPEAQLKRDPFDFALWKGAKEGEPYWDSPWGKGRPGWHIECSAMVRDCLGERIDIHMGGGDLVFPHHENEIAQSEAVTCQPLATIWMHNGMVNVEGTKMSKSLGNFTTIRQLLDEGDVAPMVLRMFVLQAQYRKPIDFTADAIASAKNGWDTLNAGLTVGVQHWDTLAWPEPELEHLNSVGITPWDIDQSQDAVITFQAAMDDDFNTPGAIAVLFDLAKDLQKVGNILTHGGTVDVDKDKLYQKWQTLVVLASVLGLNPVLADEMSADGISDTDIETLIEQRLAARSAKNYAESDRIRDELNAQGIV